MGQPIFFNSFGNLALITFTGQSSRLQSYGWVTSLYLQIFYLYTQVLMNTSILCKLLTCIYKENFTEIFNKSLHTQINVWEHCYETNFQLGQASTRKIFLKLLWTFYSCMYLTCNNFSFLKLLTIVFTSTNKYKRNEFHKNLWIWV